MTGTSFTGNSAVEGGGGIYNYDAAQVTRDTCTGNTAPVGGGMDNEWYAVVTNSTFRRNRASPGGGVYNDCQATVAGSTFARNRASPDGELRRQHCLADLRRSGRQPSGNCAPANSVPGCTG